MFYVLSFIIDDVHNSISTLKVDEALQDNIFRRKCPKKNFSQHIQNTVWVYFQKTYKQKLAKYKNKFFTWKNIVTVSRVNYVKIYFVKLGVI